jgi:hypothetical protein
MKPGFLAATNKAAMTFGRAPAGVLQRQCSCGQHTQGEGECQSCAEEKLTMQRHGNGMPATARVPSIVHDVLRSPGQPLDAQTRGFMETRFGHDFSQVRVHADSRAGESARSVGALAFTAGRNVVFGAGQYSPQSAAGRKLLAHELTHVVQQRFGTPAVQSLSAIDREDSYLEREARHTAEEVVAGRNVPTPSSTAAGSLQRTMICSKPLDAKIPRLAGARHSFIDDTGHDNCKGSGLPGNYAVTDLVSGNFLRGCAAKTSRSPDPRGLAPIGKKCNPRPGVSDVSKCLADAYAAYADPSVYSNEAVAGGAAGGAVGGGVVGGLIGGLLGGIVGTIGGAVGGARVGGRVNGPNSNTFAATLAKACCEDSSSSGLGWVPGWEHAPATPCAASPLPPGVA